MACLNGFLYSEDLLTLQITGLVFVFYILLVSNLCLL